MTNLGFQYLEESFTFNKTVLNSSGSPANASYIWFAITDEDGDIIYNTSSNISKIDTGLYITDVFLDNSTFDSGSHYAIWGGNIPIRNITYYFYYQDYIYLETGKV